MEHYHSDELIGAYLLNKLTAAERTMVQKRMAADPDFAESVRASEETIRFLEYLRDEKIRTQLRKHDADERRRIGKNRRRLLIVAVILCLICAGLWFFQTTRWEPENIARRNLLSLHERPVDSSLSSDNRELLKQAMEAFDSGDYQEAARLYHHVAQEGDATFVFEAKWNVLICHLAMDGPNERWMEEFRNLTNRASEPLRSRGHNLIGLFTSPLFRFFSTEGDSAITILKPRLI